MQFNISIFIVFWISAFLILFWRRVQVSENLKIPTMFWRRVQIFEILEIVIACPFWLEYKFRYSGACAFLEFPIQCDSIVLVY